MRIATISKSCLTASISARDNPIEPIAALPSEKITLVQVADAPALVMDSLSLSRHYRCYPGQGDYPIVDYLDATTRAGYRGPLSLQIFNDQFRGASAAGSRWTESVRYARRAKGAQRNAPPGAMRPSRSSAASSCARGAGHRVRRVCGAEADARTLVKLVEGLEFRRVGRHRSKDVDLYAQGDVSLIVNREREGFAHAFSLLHGPSVCALALRVDSIDKALKRGLALECRSYVRKIGPGEMTVPAVVGVEGSLIYFAGPRDREWRHDFETLTSSAGSDRLDKFDHLSNVVRRGEFLSWSLFYQNDSGSLQPQPQIELADPHGAFFSRLLRSSNGELRIALNIGDGGATGVSRFETFGGAGFQQIALATSNIFAAVEASIARGVEFLPIPDNYYDDLETCLGLAPDLLGRMQALGVLYEQTADGEFFHIYTRPFRDRFFFEIVERRNYDLFGAANTPVRLAAEASLTDAETSRRGRIRVA